MVKVSALILTDSKMTATTCWIMLSLISPGGGESKRRLISPLQTVITSNMILIQHLIALILLSVEIRAETFTIGYLAGKGAERVWWKMKLMRDLKATSPGRGWITTSPRASGSVAGWDLPSNRPMLDCCVVVTSIHIYHNVLYSLIVIRRYCHKYRNIVGIQSRRLLTF